MVFFGLPVTSGAVGVLEGRQCASEVEETLLQYYLVKDQVHIMARTAQISKEKRESIITLSMKICQYGKCQEL
jgi:hypothetical protein